MHTSALSNPMIGNAYKRAPNELNEVIRAVRQMTGMVIMAPDENILLDTTVVVSKEQASAELGDEAAILNLKDGVYYGLDPVGARIWKLIQTPQTVRKVRDTLLEEYDVEADRCEEDLIALLQQLAKNDLIDIMDNV